MAFSLVKKIGVEPLFAPANSDRRATSPAQPLAQPTPTALFGTHNDMTRMRTSSNNMPNRPQHSLLHGPHTLFLPTSLIDYYLLPNARVLAHYKRTATIALINLVQDASSTSTSSSNFVGSNAKPLVLHATGESLDNVVLLENGYVALLSSKTTLQLSPNVDSKTKNRTPSPKKRPTALVRANTEAKVSVPSQSEHKHKDKSSNKNPKLKSSVEALDEPKSRSGSKDADILKPSKKVKKDKEKDKSTENKKEKEKEKKKDKKDKSNVTISGRVETSPSPVLARRERADSPVPTSPSTRRKITRANSSASTSSKGDSKSIEQKPDSDGLRRPKRRLSSDSFINDSNSELMDSLDDSASDSSRSSKSSKSKSPLRRADVLGSVGRQSSVNELASASLRRSGGASASTALSSAHSQRQLSTKSQWVQVLSVDEATQNAFPSAMLHPDVCAEMGGVKRLLPGPEGSLILECDSVADSGLGSPRNESPARLYHLALESSVPRLITLPEGVTLPAYHVQSIGDGKLLLFLKNSGSEFVLCAVEPTVNEIKGPHDIRFGDSPSGDARSAAESSPARDRDESPSSAASNSPKRKHHKTKTRFGIFSWFSSSSVAVFQESEAELNVAAPTLNTILKAQSPDNATFLKFEIQNGLLTALTAVCLLTWELNGSASVSSKMNRIPLTFPIFSIAVTRDRIITGDIDGTITVHERSTGRRLYLVNVPDLNSSSEDAVGPPPASPHSGGGAGTGGPGIGGGSGLPSNFVLSSLQGGNDTPRNRGFSPRPPLSSSPVGDVVGSPSASASPLPSARVRSGSGTLSNGPASGRKMSIAERMTSRITNLYVLYDYYVVARFEHGECSVWTLSANQAEPLQKLVKRPTGNQSGRCAALFPTSPQGLDGLLCLAHSRNGTTKLRMWRARVPTASFSITSPVGEAIKAPLAAALISGELPDTVVRAPSDYADDIQKLSTRIYEFYPWLGLLNGEAICVVEITATTARPIVYANSAFEKLTLYASEEVLGGHPRFLHGKYTPEEGIVTFRYALDSGDFSEHQLLSYRKDGVPFFSHIAMLPIRSKKQHSKITHTVLIMRDVSPLRLAPRNAMGWSEVEVAMWLDEKGFSTYGLLVLHKQVTGRTLLRADEHFLAQMGVVRDDQEPLMKVIEALRASMTSLSSSASTDTSASSLLLDSSHTFELEGEGYSTSTLRRKRAQGGTLVKLALHGRVSMFLLKQSKVDGSWAKVEESIKAAFPDEGPFDVVFESSLSQTSMPVTPNSWREIFASHLHGIVRLRLNPQNTSPAGSGKIFAPKPLALRHDSRIAIAESPASDTDASLPSPPESAPPSTGLPTQFSSLSFVRSPSSSHLSDASSGTSPRNAANRLEELFSHPTSVSRSTSRDFVSRRTASGPIPSLGTPVSLSSYFGADDTEHGLAGPSLRRCIERVQKYSAEGAKTLSRLFNRAQEQYSWLASAKGALSIVENNSLHPFVFVNAEMERLTLFSRSQLLGRNYRVLYSNSTDSSDRALLDSLSSVSTSSGGGSPCLDLELVLSSANGLPFVCSLLVYPLFGTKESQLPSHFLCLHRDVTSLKLQELAPSDWSPVELSSWLLSSDFSVLARPAYDSGLTGSDLLAACDNPQTLEQIGMSLGLGNASQRADFVEWVVSRLANPASPSTTPVSILSPAKPHLTAPDHSPTNTQLSGSAESCGMALSSPRGTSAPMSPPVLPPSTNSTTLNSPSSNATPHYASSPPLSPKVAPNVPNFPNVIPATVIQVTGSPRALSPPTPIPTSPRSIAAMRAPLEAHVKRSEEKTIVKFYFAGETALIALHESTPCSLDRLLKYAVKAFGTTSDIELRIHSSTPPHLRPRTSFASESTSRTSNSSHSHSPSNQADHNGETSRTVPAHLAPLDEDSWARLYSEMRGRIIRLDITEFSTLGLPVEQYVPVLFQDVIRPAVPNSARQPSSPTSLFAQHLHSDGPASPHPIK